MVMVSVSEVDDVDGSNLLLLYRVIIVDTTDNPLEPMAKVSVNEVDDVDESKIVPLMSSLMAIHHQ